MTKTKKQKRMQEIVKRLQEYVNTYSDQLYYDTYDDETFILDMVYGIGYSLDPDTYRFAGGFQKFREDYKKELTNDF